MPIRKAISESVSVKEKILNDDSIIKTIENIVNTCVSTYKNDGKVLFCGNGGSAADAQHLAAELSGRFYYDRPPLNSEALHVNTSYLTAVGNDYGYDMVFSRMLKGIGRQGDVLIGLSTSGNSKNVIKAFEQAKESGITTVALTGESGGKMADIADLVIKVPSKDTPRIQEAHILIGHIICQLIESELFPKS